MSYMDSCHISMHPKIVTKGEIIGIGGGGGGTGAKFMNKVKHYSLIYRGQFV